jgi:hypothetical protein
MDPKRLPRHGGNRACMAPTSALQAVPGTGNANATLHLSDSFSQLGSHIALSIGEKALGLMP